MTLSHRIAALVLLGLLIALSLWLAPPTAPGGPMCCANPVGLRWRGRISLLCAGQRRTALGALLRATAPFARRCFSSLQRDAIVRSGDLLQIDGGCRITVGRLGPRRRLTVGLRIDVNQADVSALRLLPRIGPVLAGRIVADRARRGRFSSVAALARVKGIGHKTVERLSPLISVSDADDADAAGCRGDRSRSTR